MTFTLGVSAAETVCCVACTEGSRQLIFWLVRPHAHTRSLTICDRVRVAESYHWAQRATGVVAPFSAPHMSADAVFRHVPAREGVITFAWVRFDVPQTDAEGESGYFEAEIDVRYLSIANEA